MFQNEKLLRECKKEKKRKRKTMMNEKLPTPLDI